MYTIRGRALQAACAVEPRSVRAKAGRLPEFVTKSLQQLLRRVRQAQRVLGPATPQG